MQSMINTQSWIRLVFSFRASVFGSACIGLLSVLAVVGSVSATGTEQWSWVDLADSIVTGDLALRPGQDSKSWSHDGWISYGKKANPDECKERCGGDKNCWAFSWHGGDGAWSGYCYGRAPNTLRVMPAVFKSTNSGHVSGYKSFAGKPFPSYFYFGEGSEFNKRWMPQTVFEQLPAVNLFASGFSSPSTKDQSIVKGILYLNVTTAATDVANPVIARSGAVNIGVTFTAEMCIAAADYMIYLDMVQGSPSVVGNLYTWFSSLDDWNHLCIIGSDAFGTIASRTATSGKRTGNIPLVEVEPEYYDA